MGKNMIYEGPDEEMSFHDGRDVITVQKSVVYDVPGASVLRARAAGLVTADPAAKAKKLPKA
jgi:hypothetical protein